MASEAMSMNAVTTNPTSYQFPGTHSFIGQGQGDALDANKNDEKPEAGIVYEKGPAGNDPVPEDGNLSTAAATSTPVSAEPGLMLASDVMVSLFLFPSMETIKYN